MELSVKQRLSMIEAYMRGSGFSYETGLTENLYLSLRAKPFVILAGISGTGKTRLARMFAAAMGAGGENGRALTVPVRPDWSDPSNLFGHTDLNGRFIPGAAIDFIKRAELDPARPYFLCLDEMNLARVEYYMSDILSVMETRELGEDGRVVTDVLVPERCYGSDSAAREKYGAMRLPDNLYIIGTVNMDETTFPFSKKVLDRANTIEFSHVNLVPDLNAAKDVADVQTLGNDFLRSEYTRLSQCADMRGTVLDICGELQLINEILEKTDSQIGYRIRDEIVFYMLYNERAGLLKRDDAFDNEIMQKILPRLGGSGAGLKRMLCELFGYCAGDRGTLRAAGGAVSGQMFDAVSGGECRYKKSAEKLAQMVRRIEDDGFTSFWL